MSNEYYYHLSDIDMDNKVAYKFLPYLRPATVRAIMAERKISYQEADEVLIRDIPSPTPYCKEIYCNYIMFNFRYYPERKNFLSSLGIIYTPIQLPLRYRDRFHESVLSTIVFNKLTE